MSKKSDKAARKTMADFEAGILNKAAANIEGFDVKGAGPIFDLGILTRAQLEAPFNLTDEEKDEDIRSWVAPFEEFRILVKIPTKVTDLKDNKTTQRTITVKLWVQLSEKRTAIYAYERTKERSMYDMFYVYRWEEKDGASAVRLAYCFPEFTLPSQQEQFSVNGTMMIMVAGYLCKMLAVCGNKMAAVSPKQGKKSVEWVEARTHYVLVNKNHAANVKGLAAGSVVADTTHSLKRQAHTRRAHERVLRSDYFRNKKGQTLQIKSFWVGPKEWEQDGSVYKLSL